jgi:hypothetical protein
MGPFDRQPRAVQARLHVWATMLALFFFAASACNVADGVGAQASRRSYSVAAYPVLVYVPSASFPLSRSRTTVLLLRDYEWHDLVSRFGPSENYLYNSRFAVVEGRDIGFDTDSVGILVISRGVRDIHSRLSLDAITCDGPSLRVDVTDFYSSNRRGTRQESADGPDEAAMLGTEARAWLIVVPQAIAPFQWNNEEVRGFGQQGRALAVSMKYVAPEAGQIDGRFSRYETEISCDEGTFR